MKLYLVYKELLKFIRKYSKSKILVKYILIKIIYILLYKKKELGEALFCYQVDFRYQLDKMDIKFIRSKGVLGIEILIKVIRGITMSIYYQIST
ncbi:MULTISPECIES: hypothetical protein [Romboutsia]|uniref:hypothetical protein n=1 Tax=Romboutsia TaxID=1501226 RepID=UPI000B8575E2|nr:MULTISPECIES: hypothetical protein [Romboutsia]MDB8805534.1 hypothetical protein [Romboutsia sp. 1001216sp1]MDB8807442.1 hypothetical protein [Romboutsia sp. 1001216sp1]MDB8814110.1 hypothetical protein [Romboutsia sp. 1001216sp1]